MDRTGKISVARVVQEGDEVMVISSSGSVLRLKAAVISLMGRASRGLRVMDVVKGDMVASLARIPYEDLGQTTREPEAVVDSVESKEVVEPEPDPDLDFDGEPEA
jgi:DNA gyrase subunit A